MQRSGSNAPVRQALVVSNGLDEATGAVSRSVGALRTELHARRIEVVEAVSYEDGLATVVSDSGIHCILLNWTQGGNDKHGHAEATELLRAVRKRNAKIPIFLMASRDARGFDQRRSRMTLADEFIWILDDTAIVHQRSRAGAIERYCATCCRRTAAALRATTASGVFVGGAGSPGRRRLPQVAGRPRVLRLLRREPVSHRHGHRARRARLVARSQRSGRRERALCGARLRRGPLLHGAQRHLGFQSRHHVGLRRRRRDRAVRSQLPQVHRAGPGDHGRHSGFPEADAQSLRHHRPDSAGTARARGDREDHRRQSAGQGGGRQARRLFGADELHLRRHVLRRGRRAGRGSPRASTASISTKPGTATRASIPMYRDRYAMRGDPATHPKDGPTVFATHSTHKLLAALSQTSYIHIRDGRSAIDHGRFNEAYCAQASTSPLYALIASNDVAAAMMDGPAGAVAHAGDASTRPWPAASPWRALARNSWRRRTGSSRRGMPTRSATRRSGKRIPFHEGIGRAARHGSELLGPASGREVAWLRRTCRTAGACSTRSSSASSARA